MKEYLIESHFAVYDIDESVHYESDPEFMTDDWKKYNLNKMYELWSVYERQENGTFKRIKTNL